MEKNNGVAIGRYCHFQNKIEYDRTMAQLYNGINRIDYGN